MEILLNSTTSRSPQWFLAAHPIARGGTRTGREGRAGQRISDAQAEDIRQMVQRYEQLAEKALDAQQRAAVDVAELRVRLASIEQILRTVE
jgi:hypothetical protein